MCHDGATGLDAAQAIITEKGLVRGPGASRGWRAGKPLTRDDLDAVFPNNPAYVIHVSGHGAVLNSKAFEKYGFSTVAVLTDWAGIVMLYDRLLG